jgi:FkbM family methyltransferase
MIIGQTVYDGYGIRLDGNVKQESCRAAAAFIRDGETLDRFVRDQVVTKWVFLGGFERSARESGFQSALQLPDYSRRIRNMAIEQHCERSSRDTLPRRSFRQRIGLWMDLLKFAWVRGGSPRDRVRLFYYTGPKLSLVSRGWSRHALDRILSFGIQATPDTRFRVYARDNGLDVGTIAEFFTPGSKIVPVGLPPLRPKVVYDLGANIGIASLRFATLYPDARFYGFEPVLANHEVCALNYQNLQKAQAFPWAVGARSEVTAFECNEDPRGGHLQATPINPHLERRKQIDVQVYSIADLVRVQNLEPPEFLKIDVEGAEMEVLNGMGDVVQSVKRMFVETHGAALKAECVKWMQGHGFQIRPASYSEAVWGDRA